MKNIISILFISSFGIVNGQNSYSVDEVTSMYYYDYHDYYDIDSIVYLKSDSSPVNGLIKGWDKINRHFGLETYYIEAMFENGKRNGLSKIGYNPDNWGKITLYTNGGKEVEKKFRQIIETGKKAKQGRLKKVINYKDGKKDGEYITYHFNGLIESIGNYKNDEKDGVWKKWPYNNMDYLRLKYKDTIKIKNDILEIEKYSYKHKTLKQELIISENKLNSFFENNGGGNKIDKILNRCANNKSRRNDSTICYNHEVLTTQILEINKNKEKIDSILLDMSTRIETEKAKALYNHNEHQARDEKNYKDGQLHGPSRLWENGILIFELNYKNGIKDGLDKEWWPNGQIKAQHLFKDGALFEWSKWYENGLLKVENKSNDLYEIYKKWGKNGNLTYESTTKYKTNYNRYTGIQEIKNFIIKNWNENGLLIEQSKFDGKYEIIKKWSENGNLTYEKTIEYHTNYNTYTGIQEIIKFNIKKWDENGNLIKE